MRLNRRKLIVALCAAVALAIAGWVAAHGSDAPRSSGAANASTEESTARSVAAPTAGEALRWLRTEAGARQAAVAFLELTEDAVSMTPTDAAALQRSVSTAAAADRLASEVRDRLERIQAQVPDGLALSVAPIALRSVPRGEGWEVSVWYVSVATYGREIALEQWSTVTYALEWEADGWRIDAMQSTPGPVPTRPAAMTATPVAQLAGALAGFTDHGPGGA